MLIFNNYFHKNKKLKLYFGDSVVVLNDFIYQTGGSRLIQGRRWVFGTLSCKLLFFPNAVHTLHDMYAHQNSQQ
jgi:hypothetical protein